jgi:hypothetical protein
MNIRLRPTRTRIASTSEAFPPCNRQLTPELNLLSANSGIHGSSSTIYSAAIEAGEHRDGKECVLATTVVCLTNWKNQ